MTPPPLPTPPRRRPDFLDAMALVVLLGIAAFVALVSEGLLALAGAP